ncbi:PEGA domain-containing protein [Sorangium cellulosum]|uniref:PEGA domain-containing protein n=1 Tax=Sorangium cellulosum TaxID=56 RepID=UPI0004208768|nr:PEGA domain-containing protein [Sorangium cellulosum]
MRIRICPPRRAAAAVALLLAAWAAPLFAQGAGRAQPAASRPAAAAPAASGPAASAPSAAAPAAGAPPAGAPSAGAPAAEAAAKADAEARFQRGLRMYRAEAWEAAAAEFLESRRLFPTWGATSSAARCLQKLGRTTEALELFESVLADFDDVLPADAKQAAFAEVEQLRELVGAIAIEGGAPGAAVLVDGERRAELPLPAPLRVAAGAHTVRIQKDGFEPLEARVDVVGRKTASVAASLKAIETRGRLRISEITGKQLGVALDGVRVGTTPWEGKVEPGAHVIVLFGADGFGTPPTTVSVKAGKVVDAPLRAVKARPMLTAADPVEIDYKKGDPIPLGYRLETNARGGLISAGATILGVAYTPFSVSGTLVGYPILAVPVAGPLIHAARVVDSGDEAIFVIDGVLQAAGLAMIASGVLVRKTTLVREDVARTGPRLLGASPARIGRDGLGLQVVGSF